MISWLSSPELQGLIPPKFLPYIVSAIGLFQLIRRNFFVQSPTTQIAADKEIAADIAAEKAPAK